MFPTFTMSNASALATGHYLGDTGTFANSIYIPFPVSGAENALIPFLENNAALHEVDRHFDGNYLDQITLLQAARAAGFSTAAIGKLGPAFLLDHTDHGGEHTVFIDDATGQPYGVPIPPEVIQALMNAGIGTVAPARGANGNAGSMSVPGTTVANVAQQDYFTDAATKVVLPLFKARNRPFLLVFWSRDPDGTQHNQGDSFQSFVPGINGPTSREGIRNADRALEKILNALETLGLKDTTNVFVTADHGFSTISKESKTSAAAQDRYADVPPHFLPPGFVAVDLARAFGLPLYDPDQTNAPVPPGSHPKRGSGLIGTDVTAPDIIVAANGGSDLIYLPKTDPTMGARIVDTLLKEDYVSGLFVDETLGRFDGTLPLAAIHLAGAGLTPKPAIVVNFRSFSVGCDVPVNCAVEVADTALQQGQGIHGSFSRADTLIFMAAIGPDFKSSFIDQAPSSNADVGMTLAEIFRLKLPSKGQLLGRVLTEALLGGEMPDHSVQTVRSVPAANGLQTVVKMHFVGRTPYFDAGGFPGRTVGLDVSDHK